MIILSLALPDHNIHLPIAGTYRLYLSGGFSVSGLEYFGIQITQSDTKKVFSAERLVFKQRARLNGNRALACFQIQFPENGEYRLSLHNSEKICMKRSMFLGLNFLFPKQTPYNQAEAILAMNY